MDRPTLKTYLNMERRNSSTHTNMVRFSAAPCGVYIIVYFFLCLMSALGYVARPLQGSGLADRRTMVLMRRMMPRLSERNTVAAAPARIDLLLRLLLAAGPVFGLFMACHFNFQRAEIGQYIDDTSLMFDFSHARAKISVWAAVRGEAQRELSNGYRVHGYRSDNHSIRSEFVIVCCLRPA